MDEQIVATLIGIAEAQEPMESFLHSSKMAIREALNCSVEEAEEHLHMVVARGLIVMKLTPGGELRADQPMPIARWYWGRPDA